jgi:hypothetical protein
VVALVTVSVHEVVAVAVTESVTVAVTVAVGFGVGEFCVVVVLVVVLSFVTKQLQALLILEGEDWQPDTKAGNPVDAPLAWAV